MEHEVEGRSKPYKSVSLPRELVESVDGFVERYGGALGYRGRAEFVAAAIRAQMDHDEARLVRRARLKETSDLDWH